MRSSISIALTLGLFLLLGPAPQADADTTTAFQMVLLEGSTGDIECSGEPGGPGETGIVDGDCSASIGSHLKFAINLFVDAAGVNAWSIDLAWDEQLQNALRLVSVTAPSQFVRGFDNPNPPPATIGYTVQPTPESEQQSSPILPGLITQVSGGLTQDFNLTISETSFRAAKVTFVVDGEAGTDLQLGFFRTDGASMGNSASQFITPQFGSFAINAPEPSGTLLALASLSSLAILAHRRRRSD
jgi:hypothetical protein